MQKLQFKQSACTLHAFVTDISLDCRCNRRLHRLKKLWTMTYNVPVWARRSSVIRYLRFDSFWRLAHESLQLSLHTSKSSICSYMLDTLNAGTVCFIGRDDAEGEEALASITQRYSEETGGFAPFVFRGSSMGASDFGSLKIRLHVLNPTYSSIEAWSDYQSINQDWDDRCMKECKQSSQINNQVDLKHDIWSVWAIAWNLIAVGKPWLWALAMSVVWWLYEQTDDKIWSYTYLGANSLIRLESERWRILVYWCIKVAQSVFDNLEMHHHSLVLAE